MLNYLRFRKFMPNSVHVDSVLVKLWAVTDITSIVCGSIDQFNPLPTSSKPLPINAASLFIVYIFSISVNISSISGIVKVCSLSFTIKPKV